MLNKNEKKMNNRNVNFVRTLEEKFEQQIKKSLRASFGFAIEVKVIVNPEPEPEPEKIIPGTQGKVQRRAHFRVTDVSTDTVKHFKRCVEAEKYIGCANGYGPQIIRKKNLFKGKWRLERVIPGNKI